MPKHLLLADDSITIQKVVALTFAGEDFQVTAVGNGEEALTKARSAPPDVILADVVMPRRNGYELCAAVKADAALRHVPVLLLAGTFEAFDEARARAAHADGHVVKPFETGALIAKVKELVARRAGAAAHAVAAQPTPAHPSAAPPTLAQATAAQPAATKPTAANAAPSVAQAEVVERPRPVPPVPAPPPEPMPPHPDPTRGAAHAAAAPEPEVWDDVDLGDVEEAPGLELDLGPALAAASVPAPEALPEADLDLAPALDLDTRESLLGPPVEVGEPELDTQPKPRPPSSAPPDVFGSLPHEASGPGLDAPSGLELDFGPPTPLPPLATRPAASIDEPSIAGSDAGEAPIAELAAEELLPLDELPPEPEVTPPAPELLAFDELPPEPAVEPSALGAGVPADREPGGDLARRSASAARDADIDLPPLEFDEPPAPELVPAEELPPEPELEAAGAAPTEPVVAAAAGDGGEALLREALSKASREVIERIAWEVVPQLAETVVREHVERLAKAREQKR